MIADNFHKFPSFYSFGIDEQKPSLNYGNWQLARFGKRFSSYCLTPDYWDASYRYKGLNRIFKDFKIFSFSLSLSLGNYIEGKKSKKEEKKLSFIAFFHHPPPFSQPQQNPSPHLHFFSFPFYIGNKKIWITFYFFSLSFPCFCHFIWLHWSSERNFCKRVSKKAVSAKHYDIYIYI